VVLKLFRQHPQLRELWTYPPLANLGYLNYPAQPSSISVIHMVGSFNLATLVCEDVEGHHGAGGRDASPFSERHHAGDDDSEMLRDCILDTGSITA
jgi:hypothetical protein